MQDRSSVFTAAGLLLRRMNELVKSTETQKVELEQVRNEARVLQDDWQKVMVALKELERHSA